MSDRKPLQIPQYGGASITSPKRYIDYIIRKKNISLPPTPEYFFILYSASLMEDVLAKYPHEMREPLTKSLILNIYAVK